MSELQNKYASVIAAAQSSAIDQLQVNEQNGVLYITGNAVSSDAKDAVWNALGMIDATYTANDINIDVQITGITPGTNLVVNTESSNLNVREEPSTDAPVIGKAAKGELVTLVEQSSQDWWRIKTSEGVEGFAYARYLKV
ncbi:SH3 domain-containing protein [Planobacterium oryzisoli]|uniref:SH3 domain-containing protein n=1 Tax=Planobacterium oryzisoli TaxID=2771435 RepID=A0A930YUC4_9FLAO|nr:SH3 domain-containing protein [Planobacterium oryzisoli]MBF5026518.1 SH3 domain-containing protein [Planobacterium oryzisoli]